jgi:hypothetical protein
VDGCGYQLIEEELRAWLKLYGKVVEPDKEEMFGEEDGEEQFENGRYIVKMIIEREIPKVIPMFVHRVNIHYSGIKMICIIAFSYHKGECQLESAKWVD